MGKGRKKKPSEGFMSKLFRPWKSQQVTLTQAGKKQAPLRKGKASKKAASDKQEKPAAPTARQRNVREIQTLINIGKRDPQRLAGIISRMLLTAHEQEEEARLKFERLVWEKAEKKGRTDEEDPS